MVLSLLLSGLLGMLQEKTYRAYGPVWKEGLFYTVCTINMTKYLTYVLLARSCSSAIFIYCIRH